MAESLTSKLTLSLTGLLTNAGTLSTPSDPISYTPTLADLTSGTGAGKANQVYYARRTLAGTSNEDIDMVAFGGALDSLGNALAMAKIKLVLIVNKNALETDILTVGNKNTADAWQAPFNASDTGAVTVRGAGGFFLIGTAGDGYAAANPGNYLLHIDNPGANSISYDIFVIGATA